MAIKSIPEVILSVTRHPKLLWLREFLFFCHKPRIGDKISNLLDRVIRHYNHVEWMFIIFLTPPAIMLVILWIFTLISYI